jgi:hypothetical protein
MVIALLNFLVVLLVIGVIYYVITTWIPMPEPVGMIVRVVFAIILILALVDAVYGRHVVIFR